MSVFSGPAMAAPADGDLPLSGPCILLNAPDSAPDRLIRGNPRFDCKLEPRQADADTIWVRYDVSAEAVYGETGWTYDHTLIQARDEQVWILYADGRVRKSHTAREDARRIFGGPSQRYAFDRESGQIVALLARLDGLENRRGPVPRASLTSEARTESNRANINLGFGVLAGIMLGILFYNFTLYLALKYRMLAAYCGFIASTLFYGVIWSNFVLWFAPGMSTSAQFGWNALSISVCFLSTAIYVNAFVEQGMVSEKVHRIGVAFAMIAIGVNLARMFNLPLHWRLYDLLSHAAYLAAVAALLVNCVIAWHRKSTAIKLFMLAWFAPLVVTILRIFWGLGSVVVESAWFDASPFFSLALEAMLSAIGLSWRLRQLRSERDSAETRAIEFYELASSDPLTGLLNRRAFLAAVTEAEGPRSLLIIDIDHFKSINDSFGHDRGDSVLRHVARAMRDTAPQDAVIGRLGGEEFAIVCGHGGAEPLAQQLRLAISVAASWPERHVTVSIGASVGMLADYGDWRALYVLADKALYQSKEGGRDRVTICGAMAKAA